MSSGCHPQVKKPSCLSVLFDDDLRVRLKAMTSQFLNLKILAKETWKVIHHRRLSCHMDSKCLHTLNWSNTDQLVAVTGAVLASMVTSKLLCGVLKFG